MKTTAEAVKQVINSPSGVDTLVAEDMGSGEKVGYRVGTPAELCEQIDFLEANMLVPYRVKLSKSTADRKRGNKPAEDRPFVFILLGRSGGHQTPLNAAPVAPAQAAQPVPIELAKEAAANGVRNELQAEQIAQLKTEVAELKALLAEDEEEEEEPLPEPIQAAPPSAWNNPEVVKELIAVFKPIGQAAGMFVANGFKSPKQPIHTTPEQVAQASQSMSERERRILIAVRNAEAQGPEMQEIIEGLLNTYAAPMPDNPPASA